MADENNKINPIGLTNRTEDNTGGIGDGTTPTPNPPRPRPDGGHNDDGHHHHNHKHNGTGDGLDGLDGENGDDGDVFGDGSGQEEGGGGEDCFVAGTKVKMSDGLEKNIEDIQIGEEVFSYNIHTKKLELKKVTELYTQVHDLVGGDITVKTRFNNGIELHNTIANPFWSKDKGFVAADAERCNIKNPWVKETNKGKDTKQLKVGDTLYHYNGKELQEVMVTEIEHILEPYIRTYDIKVQDNHTFFANGILTHNSGGGGGGNYGCTDSQACNYNSNATIEFSPSNCFYESLCSDGISTECPDDCPEIEVELLCCLPNTQQGTLNIGNIDWDELTIPNWTPSVDDFSDEDFYYGDEIGNTGNVYNTDACNQMDCSLELGFSKVHFDGQCIGPIGKYGKFGHNVVFNYYHYKGQYVIEGANPILDTAHYPYVNYQTAFPRTLEYIDNGIHDGNLDEIDNKYYDPMLIGEYSSGDFLNDAEEYEPGMTEYDNGIFNQVFDRFQMGVDKEQTELYNLPIYQTLTCDEVEGHQAIDTEQYQGTRADYDLGKGFVKSPFITNNFYDNFNALQDTNVKGIDFCGGNELVNEAFNLLEGNPLFVQILIVILSQHSAQIWFQDIDEDWQIPNSVNGFGLNNSPVSSDIVGDEAVDYIQNYFSEEIRLTRDVLIRAGFPLPPVTIYGATGGYDNMCDGIGESYLQLVEEFIIYVSTITFFGDFLIPNVDIEPTMKNELNVLSGMDLREESLDACNYIEFMVLPGGNTLGDGIYYKGNELPDMYFQLPHGNEGNTEQNDMTKETYVRTFNCNTELNQNLKFSKMRAVCKDGSSVEMAQAGDGNGAETIKYYPAYTGDEFFNTGVEACNSQLKSNSSQDLYYLSDNDKKESLGIFFYDSENKGSENFVNTKDDSFEQYSLLNGVRNPNGRDISYRYETDAFQSNGGYGLHNLYEAEHWSIISSDVDGYDRTDSYYSNSVAPYWSLQNSECFSLDKCLVIDTMRFYTNNNTNQYDYRQGVTTYINREDISDNARRKKYQFKLSFMMKTTDVYDGVNLKDTGIHTALEFDDATSYNGGYVYANELINNYKSSQCSPYGKNKNHYSNILTEEKYCSSTRASFTNNVMDTWEKMEYVFEVNKDINFKEFNGLNLFIVPLEFAKIDENFYVGGLQDQMDTFQTYMESNTSKILVDNIEFKESFDFHTDVDVRKKKGPNDYGLVSLTEYYDRFKPNVNIEEYNDTLAPLEVQFYFYPRFSYDDVLSPNREILLEQFVNEQFYISDVDWGDNSSIEFTNEPKKLGPNIMINHTYEQSGIYEIKGTMFRTVAENYNYSFNPNNISYEGNLGVGYNQKFTLKININEGLDEDFKYFGTDGFSFIPYKNSTPIIGGYSEESIYYKSLKRNLGIVGQTETDINLLSENDLADKDFHVYPDRDGSSSVETTLGGDSGWFKINYVEGDSEYLMTYNVFVTPNTTYVESFELKHDNTLDSLNITFWSSDLDEFGVSLGHNDVAATIEDLGTDSDGNIHKRISAEFTTTEYHIRIRAIDFRSVVGDFTFLAVKNISFGRTIIEDNLVNVNFSKISDRLKSEIAFQKMDSSLINTEAFDLLNYYQQPANNDFDDSTEYLLTLPFPRYFQEFDILNINDLTPDTVQVWDNFGRPDIADVVLKNLTDNPPIQSVDTFYGEQFEDTNADFLATLPFPRYLEEFDINGDGDLNIIAGGGTEGDLLLWGMTPAYRGDISDMLFNLLQNISIEESGLSNFYTFPNYVFNWNSLSDIPNYNENTEGNTLPVLSESDTYNPAEVYINPTVENQTEQYTGKQYTGFSDELGKSLGDVDIQSVKYYNTPKSIWEMFGLEYEDFVSFGNPESPRYWKNIIPEDYSIYNREGINLNPIADAKEFYELNEVLSPEYFSGDVMGWFVCAQGDENCQSKYVNGAEAYAFQQTPNSDWECPGEFNGNCDNINKIYPNTNYNLMTFVPNTVEFCHPLLGCTGFDKGEGIMLEGPMNYDQFDFNVIYTGLFMELKLSTIILDSYSEQEWLDNYYYPVLPRYGIDGKFIENDYPNNKIPFPLEGNVTNTEETDTNLILNLSTELVENNVFDDISGKSNKGFVISDFKPKFDNESLEIKKTKNMNRIKTKKSNGAF